MAFLEGLANPTTLKDVNADALLDGATSKPEKVTITPLVQYLKDKKANRSKEAALKATKKHESQLSKNKASSTNEEARKKGKDVKTDRLVEKAAKEAVKILNREAAAKGAPGPSLSTSETSGSDVQAPPKLDVTKIPGRQRTAVVAAHIRMLQRDLGLSPAQAHRQVRRDTADAQKPRKRLLVRGLLLNRRKLLPQHLPQPQQTPLPRKQPLLPPAVEGLGEREVSPLNWRLATPQLLQGMCNIGAQSHLLFGHDMRGLKFANMLHVSTFLRHLKTSSPVCRRNANSRHSLAQTQPPPPLRLQ